MENLSASTSVPAPMDILRYIVEYADRIFVREQVHGQWGSYALTQLPDYLLARHVARFLADRRLPHRVTYPNS